MAFTVYFGGELFSTKHLLGNAALAAAVRAQSGGRYEPLLPQDLEQRDASAHAIRDEDLRALLSCDLGLFHFDGAELDAGTVVEFMTAKFADMPAVLLRTDFRSGGDQDSSGEPWNLMTSFYPRTRSVVLDAMALYQSARQLAAKTVPGSDGPGTDATRGMIDAVAAAVVVALDEVRGIPPLLPAKSRPAVYEWLALMPGFRPGRQAAMSAAMRGLQADKEARGLL